jgi:phosphoribosyl 1,2-cyclic phosphate phosphodiesterase
MQLLREEIGIVHSVVYTHEHADHMAGFDDLRLFQFYLGYPVPVYCNKTVRDRLERSFDYAFGDVDQTHTGAVPSIDITNIDDQPFEVPR